jgi:hypothetical protein
MFARALQLCEHHVRSIAIADSSGTLLHYCLITRAEVLYQQHMHQYTTPETDCSGGTQ